MDPGAGFPVKEAPRRDPADVARADVEQPMGKQEIAVFGLGYVGCISAAGLASRGHSVVGVDTNPDKVRTVIEGGTPILEEGVEDLIGQQVSAERLTATTDAADAVANSTLALGCVGTPSTPTGALKTDHLERVADDIGAALRERRERYTVVIRSKLLPTTCEEPILPRLEAASGKRAGEERR